MICDNGVIREETSAEIALFNSAENPELIATPDEALDILLGGDNK